MKIIRLIAILMCLGFSQNYFDDLADAIYTVEGGILSSVPYGVFYKGCSWANPDYCRKICLNTIHNTYQRWLKANKPKPFLEFLRDRYAPLEAHPLNKNWEANVSYLLRRNKVN